MLFISFVVQLIDHQRIKQRREERPMFLDYASCGRLRTRAETLTFVHCVVDHLSGGHSHRCLRCA
jgi:hypothetical protein